MKFSTKIFLLGAALALTAVAHAQRTVQTDTQTNGQASAQANKTNAQASGGASVSSSASAGSNRTNAGLASGTAFNAALSAPVDSKKSKPGDPVTARFFLAPPFLTVPANQLAVIFGDRFLDIMTAAERKRLCLCGPKSRAGKLDDFTRL